MCFQVEAAIDRNIKRVSQCKSPTILGLPRAVCCFILICRVGTLGKLFFVVNSCVLGMIELPVVYDEYYATQEREYISMIKGQKVERSAVDTMYNGRVTEARSSSCNRGRLQRCGQDCLLQMNSLKLVRNTSVMQVHGLPVTGEEHHHGPIQFTRTGAELRFLILLCSVPQSERIG